MPEPEFEKVIKMFHSEFDSWYNKLLEETDGNYDAVTAEICQIMTEKFQTPSESLQSVAVDLLPELIENSIVELSKEGNYSFSKRLSDSTDNKYCAKWILKKKGGTRELLLELLNENNIYVQGNTWNMIAYSLESLRNAILCWAENLIR